MVTGARYEGEFKDGYYNGQGVYMYANGDKFEGEFKDDKCNGQGVLTYANGDKFEGEFLDDKLSMVNRDIEIDEIDDDEIQ